MSKITIEFESAPGGIEVVDSDITISQLVGKNTVLPTVERDGTRYPCIPATTDRGALRRSGCRAVGLMDSKGVNIDDVFRHLVGGAKGKGNDRLDPKHLPLFQENSPVLDLFGAGDPFLRGRISSYSDIVCEDPLPDGAAYFGRAKAGVRRDPVKDGDFSYDNFAAADQAKYDMMLDLNAERGPYRKANRELATIHKKRNMNPDERQKKIDKVLGALADRLGVPSITEAEIEAKIKEDEKTRKEQDISSVALQMTQDPTDFIPCGSRMNHAFTVRDARDTTIGLMVEALHLHAVEKREYGGRRGQGGGGRLKRTYNVRVLEGRQWRNDCVLKVIPGEGAVIEANGDSVLKQCWAAFLEGIESKAFEFKAPEIA